MVFSNLEVTRSNVTSMWEMVHVYGGKMQC